MNILAIETSCDETALTILHIDESGDQSVFSVLSHKVLSQIDIHKEYGGVFPNLAKREHSKNLTPLLEQVLKDAGMYQSQDADEGIRDTHATKLDTLLEREPEMREMIMDFFMSTEKPNIDHICVTSGPGLEPALWVGINFAKALSTVWNIPVTPVNHMEGHIVSVFAEGGTFTVETPQFPALSLLISGGHTELVLMRDWMQYEKIGVTQDDAVGEAFDKVARLLGLEYPGGPKISKLAVAAEEKNNEYDFSLPRPMINSGDYNFSFSGLKTAVRRLVEDLGGTDNLTDEQKENIALEFELSVTEVLLKKTEQAILEYGIQTLIIAGGVAANKRICHALSNIPDVEVLLPDMKLTGDNSLMIAVAGYFQIKAGKKVELNDIKADGNWSL